MNEVINKTLLAIAVSGVMISPAVNATNGYFTHGYSTKEKGLAGAGTAFSQDAMAAATNPAGMAFVGERMDIGAALFSPSPRGYTVTGQPPAPNGTPVLGSPPPNASCNAIFTLPSGACAPPFSVNPGSVESENDFFLIPHFAYNWQMNDDSALGFSIYGNGGMNSKYTSGSATLPDQTFTINDSLPGPYGAGDAGINLEQVFFNISFAKKLNDKHAFGASVIVAGQRITIKGLDNFAQFSLEPDKLTSNEHSKSFGAGLRVGYQGEVIDGFRVGVSYQSKISMGEFDEYSGLFAEGGDFDIPSTYNLGVSVDVGSTGVIVADVQRINYSDVASINNPISRLTDGSCVNGLNNFLQTGSPAASGAGCLGGANGAGFGWQDMTIFKIGYQFDAGDNTFRFGYSHADQVIPDTETLFNILAPAVIEDHITAGMTMRIGGDQEFNIAGMYAPKSTVKGANPFDGGATSIEIEMSQWEVQAGWAWKY
jgi:long-chain fatty acid transport protein